MTDWKGIITGGGCGSRMDCLLCEEPWAHPLSFAFAFCECIPLDLFLSHAWSEGSDRDEGGDPALDAFGQRDRARLDVKEKKVTNATLPRNQTVRIR